MELSAEAYTAWQDEGQRERLLMDQLPQVRYIARRIHEHLPRHVPFEDLVHAGVVGLIDALHKYDQKSKFNLPLMPSFASGVRFWTACGRWTGVREICGVKLGSWKKLITSCVQNWAAIQPNPNWQWSLA